MRKLLLLPLALAVMAIPASAHQGNGPFLAIQFPDDGLPTIDGDISEWQALPDYFQVLIEEARAPADWNLEINKADLDFGYWGGYNPSNDKLYAAAWAFDDIHVRDDPDGTDCACNDDSYEFFTDADHSVDTGGDYGIGWWNITWPPVNGVSHAGGGGPGFNHDPDYMNYAVTFEGEEFGESTYYYEVEFVPFDVLSKDGDGNDNGSVQSTLDPGETHPLGDDHDGRRRRIERPGRAVPQWPVEERRLVVPRSGELLTAIQLLTGSWTPMSPAWPRRWRARPGAA